LQETRNNPSKAGDFVKPKKPPIETDRQGDLFKVLLEDIIDMKHELVRLAGYIPWDELDKEYGMLYRPDTGRPGTPTRLMVGLHYLKEAWNLSDERTLKVWTENPYWQYFCGMKYFEHKLPIDPTTMTKWRQKIGEKMLEKMIAATVKAGLGMKALKPKSFDKVNVDTTVQEKAIHYPTDARLYFDMREKLVRLAMENGVELRQSYVRLGKGALFQVGRYTHARQMKRAGKKIKKLKTYLGCVARDIHRKIDGDATKKIVFCEALAMADRLLAQKRADSNKLYSIHAPEVECIAKGKTHKKYEFGVKVGVAATSKEGFVIGIQALPGNPYDGHTLSGCIEQVHRNVGHELDGDIFVDKGYQGHDYKGKATVHIVGRIKKSLKEAINNWKRRRAAVEPEIGHMKNDGRLGRNYLKGTIGDKLNAILCGVGHNTRKLLAFLAAKPQMSTV
jgi:transposase, IS5 family